jgi:hypothetical protein
MTQKKSSGDIHNQFALVKTLKRQAHIITGVPFSAGVPGADLVLHQHAGRLIAQHDGQTALVGRGNDDVVVVRW